MKLAILAVAVVLAAVVYEAEAFPSHGKPPSCGYQSCHAVKEGFINVHIVPHTHDDVGWLKTVDQYFYGSKPDIQKAGVQYILDTVVDSLRKDRNRRFIYVETAFFWKWWIKQHDIVRSHVKKLVNNGQLEFVSGGWSMNDEAVTNYQSIIDQMTWGLRKLNDSFGECGRPKVGWQIDPFGHSKEMANIFAQLGFDGVLLGRIDYQDKSFRLATKSAEMVWRGSSSLGEDSDIFTGVMYNVYNAPSGFCFDILCNDEPIIDDRKSTEYNVDKKVDKFFEHLKNITEVYATNNVIITMGEDFNYQDAEVWFKNLDKLILYANQRQQNGSKYNLIYSTPSCYIKAIHDEAKGKVNWLLKQDDFFPYASDPHAFWTGYFTSRPTIKRFEREGNNFLQVCKQLYALKDLGPEDRVDLNALREAMGVLQHHDAITGTEKQAVAYDYARILAKGIEECEIITTTALSKLVDPNSVNRYQDEPAPSIPFISCPLTNISQCSFSEDQNSFVVTVYNPLSRVVTKFVRLPVLGTSYSVIDSKGTPIATQLMPIADPILTIPGRVSKATVELIFAAENIPPLGFRSFFIEKTSGDNVLKSEELHPENSPVACTFDPYTGLISGIEMNGVNIPVSQEFLYYKGFVGDNKKFENRSSGAYIFRPNGTAYKVTDKAQIKLFRGNIVAEVHQTFNEWVSQIIRLYENEGFVEFEWLVGPIPTDEYNGKEVISRFTTRLNSDSTFYTDSNGRELLKRVRNFRPTWKLNLQEPVSGNYYPVTSKILIRDTKQNVEFAVLTDRAQGGSSLADGQLELMVHRACIHDDAFGVGEALEEKAFGEGLVAKGSHYVVVGPIEGSLPDTGKTLAAYERDVAQRKLLDSWIFLSPTKGLSYKQYRAKYQMEYAGLKRSLPDNVQILTLEPWKGFSFLLRLEHVLEKNEDPKLSKPAVIDLKGLFSPFEITSLKETTLGANQWIKDNHRLHFDTEGYLEELANEEVYKTVEMGKNVKRETVITAEDDLKVILNPTQIRSFVIDIKKN